MAWSRIAHREPRENNRETDRFLCACILWSRYNITLVCIGEQREQWRSPTGSVNILPLSSAKGGSWLLHTPHSGGYNNRKTRRYTFFRFAKNFLRSLNARRTKKRNKWQCSNVLLARHENYYSFSRDIYCFAVNAKRARVDKKRKIENYSHLLDRHLPKRSLRAHVTLFFFLSMASVLFHFFFLLLFGFRFVLFICLFIYLFIFCIYLRSFALLRSPLLCPSF